jgi:hypothetical protein
MKKYRRRYRRFPVHVPSEPHTELVGAYEELCLDVIPPPKGNARLTDGFLISPGS